MRLFFHHVFGCLHASLPDEYSGPERILSAVSDRYRGRPVPAKAMA